VSYRVRRFDDHEGPGREIARSVEGVKDVRNDPRSGKVTPQWRRAAFSPRSGWIAFPAQRRGFIAPVGTLTLRFPYARSIKAYAANVSL